MAYRTASIAIASDQGSTTIQLNLSRKSSKHFGQTQVYESSLVTQASLYSACPERSSEISAEQKAQ
jgi:hypothetical protein